MNSYLVRPWEERSRADPQIEIAHYPWDDNGYRPKTQAHIYYTPSALHLSFISYEEKIKAIYTQGNQPVYRDSCVEFFVKPCPQQDDRYLNFEINPLGTLLLGLGEGRHGRVLIPAPKHALFQIKASVPPQTVDSYTGPSWSLQFQIPLSFFAEIFGPMDFTPGRQMQANFYKCGDETEKPHYGAWNPIHLPRPDFHCPRFFGELILG